MGATFCKLLIGVLPRMGAPRCKQKLLPSSPEPSSNSCHHPPSRLLAPPPHSQAIPQIFQIILSSPELSLSSSPSSPELSPNPCPISQSCRGPSPRTPSPTHLLKRPFILRVVPLLLPPSRRPTHAPLLSIFRHLPSSPQPSPSSSPK